MASVTPTLCMLKEMDGLFDKADDGLRIISRCFRSDATNSNIWHGAKLQALELESRYVEAGAATHEEHVDQVMSACFFADLQRVGTSSGAPWTRSLIRKQLHGLGCKLWDPGAGVAGAAKTFFKNPAAAAAAAEVRQAHQQLCRSGVWFGLFLSPVYFALLWTIHFVPFHKGKRRSVLTGGLGEAGRAVAGLRG